MVNSESRRKVNRLRIFSQVSDGLFALYLCVEGYIDRIRVVFRFF